MDKPKKQKKERVKDKTLTAPWEAWKHPEKDRIFYTNTVTGESIWEHPNNRKQSSKTSNKRKGENTINIPDEERMEVDEPQPKRKSGSQLDMEECAPKRFKKTLNTEVTDQKLRSSHREIKSASRKSTESSKKIVPTDSILPRVPWSSSVLPYKRIKYHACAIFDTCALIDSPHALGVSVAKKILTVIPYVVFAELDGLKNQEQFRTAVSSVSHELKDLQEQKSPYFRVETSVEQKIRIEEYCPDEAVKDDLILNCALRVKKEVLSISSTLHFEDRNVFLVTNDTVLCNKAMTHQLVTETVATGIYGEDKKSSKSSHKSRSSKSPSSRTEKTHRVSEEMRTTRENAVKSLKKQRGARDWINGMIKPVVEQYSIVTPERNFTTSSKPRPSIPLEDEVAPSLPKPVTAPRVYTLSKYQTYQPNKPVNISKSMRPKMPYSFSDDETNSGDEMDCS